MEYKLTSKVEGDDIVPCFVLTIWNINNKFISFIISFGISFVLTIWNINDEKGIKNL